MVTRVRRKGIAEGSRTATYEATANQIYSPLKGNTRLIRFIRLIAFFQRFSPTRHPVIQPSASGFFPISRKYPRTCTLLTVIFLSFSGRCHPSAFIVFASRRPCSVVCCPSGILESLVQYVR